MVEQARLHDSSGSAVTDYSATFFDLQEPGKNFCGGRGAAVNQHHDLAGESLVAVSLGSLWLHVFAALSIRNLDIMIEKIACEPREGINQAAGISKRPLRHEEVLLAAKDAAQNLTFIISELFKN